MLLPVIKRLVGASCGSVAVRTAANTLFYTVAFASYTPGGALASIGNELIPRSLFPCCLSQGDGSSLLLSFR